MKVVWSKWSNNIYPCSEETCGFIGLLDAFTGGQCYDPCPKCGGNREKKTGRFAYKKIFFKKHFLRVEYI